MSDSSGTNIKEYYRLITELDIGAIAQKLLTGRITQESSQRMMCDCPNHQSQSKTSLHIMLDKQGWYCFGCGVGGDVLQLVEFVQSGKVTSGQSGPMPESHKKARDYLAGIAGLPTLSHYGLSAEQLGKTEAARRFELRVKDALTETARIYNARLKESPKVLEWLKSKYAISDKTIDELLIGFADNSAGIIKPLKSKGFSGLELAASGVFLPNSQDQLFPFFDRRIIFPYWSRGRVVFMIGRKTPWTPDEKWEKGKYKKQLVCDSNKHSHVAHFINNGVLYNEDCLLTKPNYFIITEGVTDCIALMQQGFPVVSPVTVRIKADDWERLIPKMRDVQTIYICQDNEISEAGLKGALQTAHTLEKHKIDTKLVKLPLSEKQLMARKELRERFNVTSAVGGTELKKLLQGRSEEDIRKAESLLADSKIDVNDYFATGNSKEDFQKLLDEALTPIEFAIHDIPDDLSEKERNLKLEPILIGIASQDAMEQSRLLNLLKERVCKNVTMGTLKDHIRTIAQSRKQEAKLQKKKAKILSAAPLGSCKARINEILIEATLAEKPPDYIAATEAAYEWFKANGAQFFHTQSGEPFMYFDNSIYWMDSPDRGRKRYYSAMMFKNTGLIPTSSEGRTFFEVMPTLAMNNGQVRNHFSWLHSDVSKHTIYFNLNNAEHEIAKITPEGIEIMKNGGNADGVILDGSSKMKPIKFDKDAKPEEADKLIVDLIINNMTCAKADRFLIMSWLSCFLMLDFSGTRPMTRFEGAAGSGKTTASKLISTLLYGEPQHKKATDAANYTDGSQKSADCP